ncbi:hypothetical protein DBR47_03850 [Paucibacter sp. KBW04]|uniref:DUF1631 family protein n=1 Tax=Paucibacter sp. KBW04 TaxID=2153361 RepID=UPI000F58C2AB|nr:DUF1631 family protein [Paucibacter sp. KBW04]RQO62381.1 hypothetical protein DBR47_03850 [Paucibacter sp. KBW04]
MNPSESRLNPHLEAALQRIRTAVEQAAERCAEGLGLSALSAGMIKRRDALLAAQFQFRKQQGLFAQAFGQSLRKQISETRQESLAAASPRKEWAELSLMDDEQVDALVAADRIGLAIGHQSEWELREVESYVASLQLGERHPLRPEAIGQALLSAVHAVSEEAETRQILVDELTRAMAQEMRACYADIAALFRSRGLRPQDLRVRGVESAGGAGQSTRSPSLHSISGQALDFRRSEAGQLPGAGPGGGGSGWGPSGGGMGNYPSTGMAASGGSGAGGSVASGGGLGQIDPQLMDLLRRLAQASQAQPSIPGALSTGSGGGSAGLDPTHWPSEASTLAGGLPANLIQLHREELRQAATGRLDHMVIDVVSSLFDQVLSDPKVPPQMARLLARLQLPVLRAALGDPSFFSTRRHPVRLFVNRMASLACAFEDFSEDPGRAFLSRVRELVEELVAGDFEHMAVYTAKLDALEHFIAEQISTGLQSQGELTKLLARKEIDLRLQQRYAKHLAAALQAVSMPDFLRDFLAQVWSQAIMRASRDLGGAPERIQRFRLLGRDLVMSVQPKGRTAQRQVFLGQLPSLMATLGEGLDLIAWPEAARKKFYGDLLPAHAESLKGQAPSPLEANLLSRQLDTIFAVATPDEQSLAQDPSSDEATTQPAALGELDLDLNLGLSHAEASQVGLIQETSVDWQGALDIDLSAEAPLQALDISINGLPAASEAPEPSSGELLIEHLHVGFSYQMRTGEQWQKVRLAHVSAGRSFFIFTHGAKHQQTVTMTARMLRRLCESKRLRAFENAYLLERAMARTRKQLAAIGSKP